MAASGSAAMGMRNQTIVYENIGQLYRASSGRLRSRGTKSKRKDLIQLSIMNKTLKILPLGGRAQLVVNCLAYEQLNEC